MTDAAEAIPNRGYHAHIYYDPHTTRPTAERLCAVIYALWLGSPVPLKLNSLRRHYRAELLPSA